MIISYATLKTEVADWLNRTDLTSAIGTFVQLAEKKFIRDHRARKLQDRGTFSISADGAAMPSDFLSVVDWYHDGATNFGAINIVSASQLAALKIQHGTTGVPAFAAIIDGAARFAPAPDGTYSTKLTYWRKLTPLSDSNTTNWLLTDHPDIYLYGALAESAPYLKDDERVGVWKAQLEERLEELHQYTDRAQFSGTMVRNFRPIG